MTDPDLIRWAAELCGWEPFTDGGGMLRVGSVAASGVAVGTGFGVESNRAFNGVLKALMADLLAKFVEATPEPKSVYPDPWLRNEALIRAAIPQGPLAVIRAIKETGILK